MPTVGVLALQGGFFEVLQQLKAHWPSVKGVEVREVEEFDQCDALVLPGGESTSIGFSLKCDGMLDAVRSFAAKKPVWGICAGLVLLSNELTSTGSNASIDQPLVGGLDVTLSRNYFGRQSASAWREMCLSDTATSANLGKNAFFIRAPAVIKHGSGVTPLAHVDDVVVAVEQDKRIFGTAFHPELSHDPTWFGYFLTHICGFDVAPAPAATGDVPSLTAPWVPKHMLGSQEAVRRAFMIYQQGGVIMDVVNAAQARVAERAGACSVMALERIPADIKKDGGIARASDPAMIKEIIDATTIPVMAKARIGHFAEAQIIEALDVDCIDESEVLTAADEVHHIHKHEFRIPFVCGAKDLGEAMRRIAEGAAMIRLKGNAGTGNVMHAVRHARAVFSEIRQLKSLREDELYVFAKEHRVPVDLVRATRDAGRLPVVTFAAGGLATPADVSLLMQLGCDGVFVGSGIFKGENPEERARAMVAACSHYRNSKLLARVSAGLGKGMVGVLDNGETYALGGGNNDDKL